MLKFTQAMLLAGLATPVIASVTSTGGYAQAPVTAEPSAPQATPAPAPPVVPPVTASPTPVVPPVAASPTPESPQPSQPPQPAQIEIGLDAAMRKARIVFHIGTQQSEIDLTRPQLEAVIGALLARNSELRALEGIRVPTKK